MKKITFITCGGTFDKDYSISKGSYNFIIGEPKIKDILKKLRLNIKSDVISIFKKDSLDMNQKDRNNILKTIKELKNKNIIIVHGTDTMIETGQTLLEIKDKRIILVGSSLPYIFRNSDAEFNIGFAIGSLNMLEISSKVGIFIAMNGELFDINNVEKTENGIFKKII